MGMSYCTAPMLTIDPVLQKRIDEIARELVEACIKIFATGSMQRYLEKSGVAAALAAARGIRAGRSGKVGVKFLKAYNRDLTRG